MTPEEVAPYPITEEDVTAEGLAKHLCAQVQYTLEWCRKLVADNTPAGREKHAFVVGHSCDMFGIVYLLRAIKDHPDADEIARELWCQWDSGDGVGEWTWAWLTDWGIDPDSITLPEETQP